MCQHHPGMRRRFHGSATRRAAKHGVFVSPPSGHRALEKGAPLRPGIFGSKNLEGVGKKREYHGFAPHQNDGWAVF